MEEGVKNVNPLTGRTGISTPLGHLCSVKEPARYYAYRGVQTVLDPTLAHNGNMGFLQVVRYSLTCTVPISRYLTISGAVTCCVYTCSMCV